MGLGPISCEQRTAVVCLHGQPSEHTCDQSGEHTRDHSFVDAQQVFRSLGSVDVAA